MGRTRRERPAFEIDDATEKQRLEDEDFKDWAKKNMRIPSDNARRAYDRQRVDGVWAATKNWMRGVKLRHAEHTEIPEDARMEIGNGGAQADLPRFDAEKAGISARARIKTAQMKKAAGGLIGKKMTVGGKEASMERDDAGEYAWSGYSQFLHHAARRTISKYAKSKTSWAPLARPEVGSSTTGDSISKTDSIVNGGSASERARQLKGFAKRVLYAKADVLDNLQAVLDTAHNERYTPYEELKNTPGHEKNTERDHNRWAGGMYTYDVNFTTQNQDGTRQRWNATAVVRVNANGKRFVYDIVNLHDGSPISTSIRNGYLARKGRSLPAVPGNIRYIKSKDGHVVGWYDRAKKEIVALPGATAETMAHELGWHATYDYAVELAKSGDDKLLNKLNEYAEGAKNIIIDPVTGRTLADEITERYKRNGVDDPAVLLDEIGAARFTREHVKKIKDIAARRIAAKWYERI